MNTTVFAYIEMDEYPLAPRTDFCVATSIYAKAPRRYVWVDTQNGQDEEIGEHETPSEKLVTAAWLAHPKGDKTPVPADDFYDFLECHCIAERNETAQTWKPGVYKITKVWYEDVEPDDYCECYCRNDKVTAALGEEKLKEIYESEVREYIKKFLYFVPLYSQGQTFGIGDRNEMNSMPDDDDIVGYVLVEKNDDNVRGMDEDAIYSLMKAEVEEHTKYLEGEVYLLSFTADYGPISTCYEAEVHHTLYGFERKEVIELVKSELTADEADIYVMWMDKGKIVWNLSDMGEDEYNEFVEEFTRDETCDENANLDNSGQTW